MIDGLVERLIMGVERNALSHEKSLVALEILVGTLFTMGATLIAIGSGFAIAMADSTGEDYSRNITMATTYYIGGGILFVLGARLFAKAFFKSRKKVNHQTPSTKLKILVDEMLDGTDEKLRNQGYEAYSVKKLRDKGEKLQSDYSILKYSEVNHMILVTEDDENIDGCTENGIKVVKHGQNDTFEDLMSELNKLAQNLCNI